MPRLAFPMLGHFAVFDAAGLESLTPVGRGGEGPELNAGYMYVVPSGRYLGPSGIDRVLSTGEFASCRAQPSPPDTASVPCGWFESPSAAALLALAGACGQDDAAGEAIFTPEVIATAALPLSEDDEVALLADSSASRASADSYETQVRCVDALDHSPSVGVFGRQGEGPGEFGRAAYLARGEEGTVGVHCRTRSCRGRFTVFLSRRARTHRR